MLAPMPRAVRALVALASVLGTSGCAGIGQPAPYDNPGINGLEIPTPSPAPADFVAGVDNPWLALEPGAAWHYEVTEQGHVLGTIDTEVLDGTTEVAGLDATAVRTTKKIDGKEDEETRFYAQDDDGNVWVVGVESASGLSWQAGEDTTDAEAGLAMPAHPRLGDGWLTFRLPHLLEPSTTVEDQTRERVQTRESSGGQADTTRNIYESGVGLVSVEDLSAGWQAVLVEAP